MVYRFRINKEIRFDSIRIMKRRDNIERRASEDDFAPDVREFLDPYWQEGDQYSHCLILNDEIVTKSEWQEVSFLSEKRIKLESLFHPEEAKAVKFKNKTLVSLIHQSSNPNGWWGTTRSWLVRVEDGYITCSDEFFFPSQQEPFNYEDLQIGNLYLMPQQTFNWLEYLSFQIEKPFYNYPDTIPKAYSINEMTMALQAVVDYFNGQQPCTHFGFQYGCSFGYSPFPEEEKILIIELAAIELIKANVINWLELKFGYSDGVDIEITKYDDYLGYLDGLKGDIYEKIDRSKSKYIGSGVFNGSKFGFSGPWGTGGTTINASSIPILKVLRDIPGARGGVFNLT